MKKLFTIATVVAAMVLVSCGAKKSVANTGVSPFGDTYEMPAAEYDTDEEFGATGIASGSKMRMDVLQRTALNNAQNIVRQKMQHAYKGAFDDYMNYVGNNVGADAQAKAEAGGTQIMDLIVNDTKATKVVFSSPDEKGNVTCFVGIRVNKKAVSDKIADYVSEDEELKIRFKEDEFRKKMEAYFKKYKENK